MVYVPLLTQAQDMCLGKSLDRCNLRECWKGFGKHQGQVVIDTCTLPIWNQDKIYWVLGGTDALSTNLDIYSKNCGSFGFMQNKLESKRLQIMYTNHIIWQEKRL